MISGQGHIVWGLCVTLLHSLLINYEKAKAYPGVAWVGDMFGTELQQRLWTKAKRKGFS